MPVKDFVNPKLPDPNLASFNNRAQNPLGLSYGSPRNDFIANYSGWGPNSLFIGQTGAVAAGFKLSGEAGTGATVGASIGGATGGYVGATFGYGLGLVIGVTAGVMMAPVIVPVAGGVAAAEALVATSALIGGVYGSYTGRYFGTVEGARIGAQFGAEFERRADSNIALGMSTLGFADPSGQSTDFVAGGAVFDHQAGAGWSPVDTPTGLYTPMGDYTGYDAPTIDSSSDITRYGFNPYDPYSLGSPTQFMAPGTQGSYDGNGNATLPTIDVTGDNAPREMMMRFADTMRQALTACFLAAAVLIVLHPSGVFAKEETKLRSGEPQSIQKNGLQKNWLEKIVGDINSCLPKKGKFYFDEAKNNIVLTIPNIDYLKLIKYLSSRPFEIIGDQNSERHYGIYIEDNIFNLKATQLFIPVFGDYSSDSGYTIKISHNIKTVTKNLVRNAGYKPEMHRGEEAPSGEEPPRTTLTFVNENTTYLNCR